MLPHKIAFVYATKKEYEKAVGQYTVSMLFCLFVILIIGLSYKFIAAAYGWPWWMFPITMATWYVFTFATVYFSINPRPRYDPLVHGKIVTSVEQEDDKEPENPEFDKDEW